MVTISSVGLMIDHCNNFDHPQIDSSEYEGIFFLFIKKVYIIIHALIVHDIFGSTQWFLKVVPYTIFWEGQSPTLSPRLHSHASATRIADITGVRCHSQLIFVFLVETAFCHIGQAGLELLASSDHPPWPPKGLELQTPKQILTPFKNMITNLSFVGTWMNLCHL